MRIILIEGDEKVSRPLSGEIFLTTQFRGGQAMLEVAPSGAGIPGQALPQIFDGFCCANPVRTRSVSGARRGWSKHKQT